MDDVHAKEVYLITWSVSTRGHSRKKENIDFGRWTTHSYNVSCCLKSHQCLYKSAQDNLEMENNTAWTV